MNTFTTVAEDDWEHLTDEWQTPSGPLDLPALARRIHRRTLWMRALLVLEIVLTIGALAMLGTGARAATTWDAWLVIAALFVFTASVWWFTLRNRRGTWRAGGYTLLDYYGLEARREQRLLRAAVFVQRLAAVTIPLLSWLAWYRARADGHTSVGVTVCIGAIIYLLGWGTAGRLIQWRGRLRA